MSEKRYRELAALQKMMTAIPGFDRRDPPPKSCQQCEYYHPEWQYRYCYHTHCPYGVKDLTLRPQPLKDSPFPVKAVCHGL